jgi:hypothetical protein
MIIPGSGKKKKDNTDSEGMWQGVRMKRQKGQITKSLDCSIKESFLYFKGNGKPLRDKQWRDLISIAI